jgi:hypothetical protein
MLCVLVALDAEPRLPSSSIMRQLRARTPRSALALTLCACGSPEATQDEFAPDAPFVIESSPRDGESRVSATLENITATFSEAMDLDGWSWVTEVDYSAPSITGIPFYIDATTTVLPVRLEPNTAYAIWLNSPDDSELRKFTNTDGVSARAYRIAFTTDEPLD